MAVIVLHTGVSGSIIIILIKARCYNDLQVIFWKRKLAID